MDSETYVEAPLTEIERIAAAIVDARSALAQAEHAASRLPHLRDQLAALYAKMRAELGSEEPATVTPDTDVTLPAGPHGDEAAPASEAVLAELETTAEMEPANTAVEENAQLAEFLIKGQGPLVDVDELQWTETPEKVTPAYEPEPPFRPFYGTAAE